MRDPRLIPGTKRDGRAKERDGKRERGETGRARETDGCRVGERQAGREKGERGRIRPHENRALLKGV